MLQDNKIWVGTSDDGPVYLLPSMSNRHGLIAGATGTGKTVSLKVLAESFSDMGVPVFLSDIKSDLSGMVKAGVRSESLDRRLQGCGVDADTFEYKKYPTVFWDVYAEQGHPIRATVEQMGPLLLTNQPEYLSATFITMIITNILMVIVAMGIAKVFAQILAVPYSYLGPIILMLATVGSYSEGYAAGVFVMVLAGVLGIAVKYMHLNSAAIVLGLVLGRMCEEHFSRAYVMSRGNLFSALFGTPIAAVVMTACILMLLSPLYMPLLKKLFGKKKAQA